MTGSIRHIQHVTVMEGGHDPDEREIEAMCREALRRRGHLHEGLDALHIDPKELEPFRAYRVDPRRRTLEEHPRPSAQR
jgi:hypothetical protein